MNNYEVDKFSGKRKFPFAKVITITCFHNDDSVPRLMGLKRVITLKDELFMEVNPISPDVVL